MYAIAAVIGHCRVTAGLIFALRWVWLAAAVSVGPSAQCLGNVTQSSGAEERGFIIPSGHLGAVCGKLYLVKRRQPTARPALSSIALTVLWKNNLSFCIVYLSTTITEHTKIKAVVSGLFPVHGGE